MVLLMTMPGPPPLSPSSPTPLYEQLADWIADEIVAGQLPIGFKFADSRELADQWHVAYQTVRRTMVELGERGLVESRVGKGTFVTASRARES